MWSGGFPFLLFAEICRSALGGSLLRRSYVALRTVVDGECVHLFRRQLCCNCAHLLVDVVLAHALGESRKLAFDVSGVLALQRRRSELVGAGTMTG